MRTIVLDTVVFVRCLINPFGRWGRLVFSAGASYRLVLSQSVLTEILEVLNRPEITRKFRHSQDVDMRAVLNILAQADLVDLASVPRVSRDIKDDKFLATAKAANADYLVTEDEDLLVLGEYEGTKIITAETFLHFLAPPSEGKS